MSSLQRPAGSRLRNEQGVPDGPPYRDGPQAAGTKLWIDRIFEANPSMKDVYPNESRYILEPFCIENGQIEFFDLGKTPINREAISSGKAGSTEKDLRSQRIASAAGTCQEICPQQCIQSGSPFAISQEHCLHCGLCAESCPVQAVRKRGGQK